MNIQISGRRMELGEALKQRIAEGLEGGVRKYFDRPADGAVIVAKEGIGFHVDCNVHLSSGVTLQAHGEASDVYAAFEKALDKIEKRVRRYKRKLKDHHKPDKSGVALAATDYLIAGSADIGADDGDVEPSGPESEWGDQPLIVAETRIDIKTLTVSGAVLQLELMDVPALLFRNAAGGGLNLVYRRPDGHIGWVDPARITS